MKRAIRKETVDEYVSVGCSIVVITFLCFFCNFSIKTYFYVFLLFFNVFIRKHFVAYAESVYFIMLHINLQSVKVFNISSISV